MSKVTEDNVLDYCLFCDELIPEEEQPGLYCCELCRDLAADEDSGEGGD